MSITVGCKCGQRFAAQDSLAGKSVRCPSCQGVISIPSPQPKSQLEPLSGISDLDDLSQFESAAAPVQSPLGGPASTPLGGPLGAPTFGSPLGGPGGWNSQMMPGQSPGSSGGMSKGVLFALIGGGAALLIGVVALIVVLAVNGSSDENEVAGKTPDGGRPNAAAPAGVPTSPPSNPLPTTTPTSPRVNPDVPSTVPRVPNPNPAVPNNSFPTMPIAPNASPTAIATNADTNSNLADLVTSNSTPDAPPTSSRSMAAAATDWYGKPNADLRGSRHVKAKEDLPIFYDYSWMCDLLPYMGYEKLHRQIKFDQPWHRDPNHQHAQKVIPEFLNPADNRREWTSSYFRGMGLTHFVGMSGIEDERNVVAARLPRTDPRAGVFGYDTIAKPSEITDGTSQTIMIIGAGEVVGCWIQGGGATVRGAREPYFHNRYGFGLRGLADKGTMVMMADGSVRHIASDIDPAVFRSLCTIHGNEPVQLNQLGPTVDSFSAALLNKSLQNK